jgi:hypothetical protein
MRTDDPLGQSLDGKVLEANHPVGLPGSMHDNELARMARSSKCLLDPLVERFGDAHQREPVDRYRRPIRDGGNGFVD